MDKRRQPQLDLLEPEEVWRRSLLAKVEGLIPWQVYENLSRCGEDVIYRSCKGCGKWSGLPYQCSMKFCPRCNWRIARKRAELCRLWTMTIEQPKHVVLTCRNFPVLTRKRIRDFGRAFAKLRRQRLWRDVEGGCVSTEITNEGKGWHLHAHILANVRWLPADQLAVLWGKLVGQDFGIVKVKDCRGESYVHEVTKYVVKGAQLAAWAGEEIAQFIHAIKGVRFFAAFGSLFALQREIRAKMEANKPPPAPCECGCMDFTYETERASICKEFIREHGR